MRIFSYMWRTIQLQKLKLHTLMHIYKYRKEQVPLVFTVVEVIICIVFEGNGTDKYKYPKSNRKLSLDRTS